MAVVLQIRINNMAVIKERKRTRIKEYKEYLAPNSAFISVVCRHCNKRFAFTVNFMMLIELIKCSLLAKIRTLIEKLDSWVTNKDK